VSEQDNKKTRRIAVIGGGISGLAAAHRLVELLPDGAAGRLVLFDESDRLGGVLWTLHEDGYQVEQSADNFITTFPWGLDLSKRLGLSDELVETNPAHRRTFVVRGRRLAKLPDGFMMMAPTRMWPMAVTPILSPLGKLRAAMEYFIPPRKDDADESMAQFVRRRLGREVFDRLVEPLVSAVYAADMEKLSVLATLPRFRDMEREHGSLIRAMRKARASQGKSSAESGARYSLFVTLREGLASMIDALARRMPEGAVRMAAPIEKIERDAGGWSVVPAGGPPEPFDAVIVATGAAAAAKLLVPVDVELGRLLGTIEHEGTAIVTVAFKREQIDHPLDGMGFVVPAVEKSPILAGSFSSRKYPHRAPEGIELLRVFVGGAQHPELAELESGELTKLVLAELARLLGTHGDPIYQTVAHWPATMPQYHVGHKELVASIQARAAQLPGFALAGNAYGGVGIPNCIHSGEQAAEAVCKCEKVAGG
jgi:oxygen-dependent protoporphyrinogen oxidase